MTNWKKYHTRAERLKAKREQSKKYYRRKGHLLKKEGYKKNLKKILAYKKRRYYENKERFLKEAKEYRSRPAVKARMHKYLRVYWKKNAEKLRIKKKEYALKNKEYLKKKKKEYALKNKKWLRKKKRERVRRYYKTRPQFKLKEYLRNRVREVLKEQKTIKSTNTFKLIGCQPPKLRSHLEKLFKPKMNWNNYGKWHVDHIIPCSKFDLTDLEQQKICFNYKNLQPLWASDNIRKSNK